MVCEAGSFIETANCTLSEILDYVSSDMHTVALETNTYVSAKTGDALHPDRKHYWTLNEAARRKRTSIKPHFAITHTLNKLLSPTGQAYVRAM